MIVNACEERSWLHKDQKKIDDDKSFPCVIKNKKKMIIFNFNQLFTKENKYVTQTIGFNITFLGQILKKKSNIWIEIRLFIFVRRKEK